MVNNIKERIRGGSAKHYEWVVGNGRSVAGMVIDCALFLCFMIAIGLLFILLIKGG
tara:strand:+ start:15580 stop:15747 length:168 start_codon:yes stop_codon:yes gene_type:complete